MAKGITAKAQKEGESHVRYKKAVEKVISLATSAQEKASLRMMVVQEFLVERDESGTTTDGIRPWGFAHGENNYRIGIDPSKMSGRSKRLNISIGRPPEQSDLADSMRAINVTFKLFASISKKRLATIDAVAAKTILQDAGAVDERFLIQTAGVPDL